MNVFLGLFDAIKEPLIYSLTITIFGLLVAALAQLSNIIMGFRLAQILDVYDRNKLIQGFTVPILYAVSAILMTLTIVLIINGLPYFDIVLDSPDLLNNLSNSAICIMYVSYAIGKIVDMLNKHREFLNISVEE